MRLLLDTHALLWFDAGDARLSPRAREAIEDAANTCHVSHASAWEIAIKLSLGRLMTRSRTPHAHGRPCLAGCGGKCVCSACKRAHPPNHTELLDVDRPRA